MKEDAFSQAEERIRQSMGVADTTCEDAFGLAKPLGRPGALRCARWLAAYRCPERSC